MNIELPAVRERLFEAGDTYIVPVLLDDTKLPGILETTGRIDMRSLGIQEAASLIAKKVFEYRYRRNLQYALLHWREDGFLRVADNVPTNLLLDVLCYYMYSAVTTEIRISTFTPLRLFQSGQFRLTLEMLCHRMAQEHRNGTLRVYCLPRDEESLRPFTLLSREPLDVVTQKLDKGRGFAVDLLERANVKDRLRMQILHHSGFSPFHVFQFANHLFFYSFVLGQKQDNFTVYYFDKDSAPTTFVRGFDNLFIDLEMRALHDTLNWF